MISICCGLCATRTRTYSSFASVSCLRRLSTTSLTSGCRRFMRPVSRRPSCSLAPSQTFVPTSKFVVCLLSPVYFDRHHRNICSRIHKHCLEAYAYTSIHLRIHKHWLEADCARLPMPARSGATVSFWPHPACADSANRCGYDGHGIFSCSVVRRRCR